jgi:asparagine synthase (glutamine-hydrolysing)
MCGIAGIFDFTGAIPEKDLLIKMGSILNHRGPDDHGIYSAPGIGLSHRRLSIIDISSNGHQPMSNEDGSIWIVYNGEIYNYRELTIKLEGLGHIFRTHSDTEVIIHAYLEWGSGCLEHFNGMFAFAIWDARKKKFFAARDRLGIKPFYYFFDGQRFVFGSEIKAILVHPSVSVYPDSDTIRQYLLFGNTIGDSTWYHGVAKLPPGYMLEISDGKIAVSQYWDVKFQLDYSRKDDSFAQELQALLKDAVHLQLRSDVPVGAHLSGGVDSSSVVALAAGELEHLHTFSSAYAEGSDYDEREYIDIVSKRFGTQHHVVLPRANDIPDLLPKLIWHMDEPVIGAAILPMYRVSEMVRKQGIKVVNGGQGADECFGGYPPYFVHAAYNLMNSFRTEQHGPWSELVHLPQYLAKGGAFRRFSARFNWAAATPAWIRNVPKVRSEGLAYTASMKQKMPSLQPFELASYLDLKHYLPGLLQQEDRMSMAWSIESRVPLLDHRVIELAAKMPSWMKVRSGWSKSVLRNAVRGITPDAILNRKDKKGYPVPLARWFREDLAKYIRNILVDSQLESGELIDQYELSKVVDEHQSGKVDHSGILWRALTTELWFRGLVQETSGSDYLA